mgnify:CR=1 FL=1
MARYSRIFAALDGGDTQEAVARRTFSIAHDNNAEVLFGHVIDNSKIEIGAIGEEELIATRKQTLRQALERYFKRAEKDECIPSLNLKVGLGEIAPTLENELIKPFNPDLVICGVRGLSSIKYAFVGSVSTHLIHHMNCDVLVVRPEAIEDVNLDEYEGL